MTTNTKNQLIEFIRKKDGARPSDLVKFLGITPQAVHRHLKNLVASGVLEPRGSAPFTSYVIAGTPDFSRGFRWFVSGKEPNSQLELCETRDVFSGRLSHLVPFQKQGLPVQELPLVIALAGEIGNNSYDHNLGQWKDVPGCWFETQMTKQRLWILIADRGQGIFKSLSSVVHNLAGEQAAIEKAFVENISGRSPEKRGNGLKFVVKIISEGSQRGIACRSGSGEICYGDLGETCVKIIKKIPPTNFGTITLIAWGIK